MEEATITSKGQVTIPKDVRESLGLKEGSKIGFFIRDSEAVIRPIGSNPIEEFEKLRSKIKFTKKEISYMIKESKKEWSKL
ncbi:MAG: AbrB/MazE/SpoVT family DNA-binding domain-containing protein [Candidatus Aenigmarchaeota archaeon]|nr:AbrB/MazE/SpoVT family DNA-binding domain-containing protein [Candidatus Aenigmarchaeota archaeon]